MDPEEDDDDNDGVVSEVEGVELVSVEDHVGPAPSGINTKVVHRTEAS